MKTAKTSSLKKAGIRFTKMSGTGNDFLIVDAREGFPDFDRGLLAKNMCRRHFSVGADGAVFINKSKNDSAAFSWDFFNSDGGRAEMCGNAARCVARFAHEKGIAEREFSFETGAGLIQVHVASDGVVDVQMTAPKIIQDNVEIELDGRKKAKGLYIDTGVPHFVIPTTDWNDEFLNGLGHFLRHHSTFKKTRGANITFFEKMTPDRIQSATYERGVESVTLSCGTGAVAAAVGAHQTGAREGLLVQVPGGVLGVKLGPKLSSAILSGDAHFICEGEIFPEALL